MLGKKDKNIKDQEEGSKAEETAAEGSDADFSRLGEAEAQTGKESAELAKARAELAEMKEKYLRALAEHDNYVKRARKEQSDSSRYEGARIVTELLAVLDNLSLAISHGGSEPEKLRRGLEMIHKLFIDTLQRFEIRPEPGIGKKFDPAIHQALSQVPSKDAEAGTIIGELKQAFYYRDKLIRPGEVVVASAAPAAGGEEAETTEENSKEKGA